MSATGAVRRAWSLWALCVVLTVSGLVLFALAHATHVKGTELTADVFGSVLGLVFPTVGALVASRDGELRGVVREAMQPAHVSLWLRAREVER